MKNTPIVIFTYRRIPNKLIESLLKNSLVTNSELFIFSDGYKSEIDKEDVLEVREYLQGINGFKNIVIFESIKNKGLAQSIIEGVSVVIAEHNKVIVLEDDLIVSDDFLDYMNNGLKFYKDNKNIWAISGYSPNLESLKTYDKNMYLSYRANSWGWATWEDRWNSIDWNIEDWNHFKKDKKAIQEFNRGGNDMFKMLELQMLGKIDSWAIRWCYNQFKQKTFTIYPSKSKIINHGFDNKGTHNNNSGDRWKTELDNTKISFLNIKLNDMVIKDFYDFYSLNWKTKIGYILKKYGGYKIIKKLMIGMTK